MNEKEILKNWANGSKQDLETAEILFENKKYHHALFFCHLSLEKYLKAIIVKTTRKAPPLIHDLVRLAEKTDIKLTNKMKNELADISLYLIYRQDMTTTSLVFSRKQIRNLPQSILK